MSSLKINPERESTSIIEFIKRTLEKTGLHKFVIGISGGIDSATSLFLAKQAIGEKNIITVHLPYFTGTKDDFNLIIQTAKIPDQNVKTISIQSIVDEIVRQTHASDEIQKGNIMARVRMIVLFQLAKQENALVLGTENKSEHLLGYFTRFGDQASDIEPIEHLYKTQIYQLASYLQIPEKIIQKKPSANLWEDQTDESEFGFSYEEADSVLFSYFEQKQSLKEIEKKYPHAHKIIKRVKANKFKNEVPYLLNKNE